MGWWQCEPLGKIATKEDNLYNGDAPADLMDNMVGDVLQLAGYNPTNYHVRPPEAITKTDLLTLLIGGMIPDSFSQANPKLLLDRVAEGWKAIEQEYRDCIGRDIKPQEKYAVVIFVIHVFH